jgi:hypothetical protein
VPILAIGRPGSGLTAIRDALAGAPQQLVATLEHWAPLSFDDLARLAGVQYNARPNSSAFEIGLAPNPLAWPDQPRIFTASV